MHIIYRPIGSLLAFGKLKIVTEHMIKVKITLVYGIVKINKLNIYIQPVSNFSEMARVTNI